MKTVKELLSEGKTASFATPVNPSDRKVKAPPTLLWRRIAIRTFPDNHIVVLYYSQQIDRYVSIPFGPDGKAGLIDLTEKEELDAWKNIKRKGNWKGDEHQDQPNDISIDWKKIRRKKTKEQLDEFAWVPAAIEAGTAAARVAGPAIVRGAVTAGRFLGSKAGRLLSKGGSKGANLGQLEARKLVRARMTRWQRLKNGLIGAGAGAAVASGNASSDDKGTFKPNSPHEFNDEQLSRLTRISNPINVWTDPGKVNNPVTNYRQRQNMNYVWNTQPTRIGAVQENFKILERIIESNKSEILGETGISVTPRIAKKLVNLHNSLNNENKQNFEKMISENADSLRKVINFSLRI